MTETASSSMNVCNEIRCPWSKKDGCDRYSVSGHCHLLGTFDDGRRHYLRNNQYWIFADDNDPRLDINILIEENAAFLATDDRTLRQVERLEQMKQLENPNRNNGHSSL